jgi:hypothetical protein
MTTHNRKNIQVADSKLAQTGESSADNNITQDEFVGSVENLTSSVDPAHDSVVPYGVVYGRHRGRMGTNSLPLLSLQPRQVFTFRYRRTDSTQQFDVSVGDLARSLVAAASSSTYRYIIRTFRIRHVTVRAAAAAIGEQANCSLQYLGQNTNEIEYRDYTMKIDENAMVSRPPPRMSLASYWHDVTNDSLDAPLFRIISFGGGELFVDVKLEYLTDVDRYVNFTLSGGTGLDPGGIYKGPLASGLEAIGGTRLE